MGKRNQPPDIFSTPIWATRITNLLEERGMTQLELAKQSGTSPASISDWVGGSSQRESKDSRLSLMYLGFPPIIC